MIGIFGKVLVTFGNEGLAAGVGMAWSIGWKGYW